jgi:DNA helicase-2/ATP-dependent DNA helicase PcrA
MTKKLKNIFSGDTNILIGTIDSIALKIIQKFNLLSDKIYFIQEYIHIFNSFLQTEESFEFKTSIKFMFIDEFQDINDDQYAFINHMYKSGTKICGVGDDYQNIYEFRNSNIEYILKFKDYFNNCEIYTLTDNFRSTQEIISVCNDIIAPNKNQIDKVMNGHKNGTKPQLVFLPRKEHQYMFILQTIRKLKVSLDNVAILSRNNSFLVDAEDFFNAEGIPNVLLTSIEDFQTTIKKNHLVISTFHKSN